jgi:endonuclease III related protein
MNKKLLKIYNVLLKHFGKQNWWPADSPFEVIVGAILTQNTNWNNVEKSIFNLKQKNVLTPEKIYSLKIKKLSSLIKPSGFYNQKAKSIYNFVKYLKNNFNFDLKKFLSQDLIELRKELLNLFGIGKETADSIILYAALMPKFVVDAYTFRICERIGINNIHNYTHLQKIFEKNIKPNTKIYNEFHALIVKLAKIYCRKTPICDKCPLHLKKICKYKIKK